MITKLLKQLLERLKERSTWVGLITILTSIGINIKPELSEGIVSAGMGIVGLVFVLTRDLMNTDTENNTNLN